MDQTGSDEEDEVETVKWPNCNVSPVSSQYLGDKTLEASPF